MWMMLFIRRRACCFGEFYASVLHLSERFLHIVIQKSHNGKKIFLFRNKYASFLLHNILLSFNALFMFQRYFHKQAWSYFVKASLDVCKLLEFTKKNRFKENTSSNLFLL